MSAEDQGVRSIRLYSDRCSTYIGRMGHEYPVCFRSGDHSGRSQPVGDVWTGEYVGIAVTKVDTRKSYYKQTMDTLHELENIHVFEQVIRVDSAIEWSQDNSIPVVEYKKSSRSAKEYTQLPEEVMEHVSR